MRARISLIIIALVCALPAACGSPAERSAEYLEKAQKLFDDADYTTARIEAMNAAQIEPRNADVRYLLAQIEEKEQNFRQAVGHLQVAVDADPNHLPSRIKLGNYYVLGKAVEQAQEQAAAAAAIAPDDPRVMMLNARVLYLQDKPDEALAEIERALESDASLVDATMFKAGIFVARKEFDTALELVDGALKSSTGDETRKLRQFRIILLRSADRNDEVEADLKALIEEFPDEESYAVTLAQLYVTQDRIDEAEALLRQVVAAAPDDPVRRIDFARFIATERGMEAAEAELLKFVEELPQEGKLKLALGRLYESQQRPAEAYAIYEQIADAEPTSESGLAARNRMVAIKVRDNETETARQMIAEILEVEPDNADALLVRAAFAFAKQDFDSAVADLRTVLRSDPQSTRALLLLARSHVGAGDPELAQDAYRRLVALEPNHPTASNELADLLARSGDVAQAEEVLRRKLEVSPDDRRSASNLVEALLLKGDTEAAEEEVRSLMETDDPSGLTDFQLGRVMQAKQSPAEAIAAYKRALEKNPGALQALQGLTATLVEDGRSDEAIAYLQRHLEQHPEQIRARLLLGAVYTRVNNRDAAAAQFESIIEEQPSANRAYASLAALYPDDPNRRAEIYQRGVKANPDDATLSFLLAGEYERAGKIEDAVELYEAMLEVDADNAIAANNLAALLLDHRSDNASFQRALELSKGFAGRKEPALVDTLGWAYYRNGDYKSAVRYLEIATAAAGQVAQLRYHLGMAYLKDQNVIQARKELEKSLQLANADFPGIDVARATLEQLQAEDDAQG